MRPSLFKITAICVLFISVVTAQTRTVYKNTFKTNKNTKLNLDLTNASVSIETTSNNEIQIDFSLEFDNYSEEGIQRIVDGIQVSTRTLGDMIDFRVVSKSKLSRESYALNSNEGLTLDFDDFGKGNAKKNSHKTQENVLSEIRKKSNGKGLFDKFKILGEDGKKRKIDKKNVQYMKSRFVIKIPKNLYFQLQGIETQIFIQDALTQRVDISVARGLFRAKKIENKESRLSATGSNVYVESVSMKQLMLDDVSKGLFGSVDHTDCTFKGSRVELGFIGKEVSIRDYNSKIFFYNFDKNFETLPFHGEYTELFVYDFENKVKMKAKGNMTLMFDDGNVISSRSRGLKPKTTPTSMEKDVNKDSYGKIEVNLENGALHVVTDKEKKS